MAHRVVHPARDRTFSCLIFVPLCYTVLAPIHAFTHARKELHSMTIQDLNDMQRYLVEEEAEHWQEGSISRREFIHRVTLLVGGAAAASSVLMSLGCDTNATETQATATLAPASTSPANPTAQSSAGGSASEYHVDENDPSLQIEIVDIPQPLPELKLKGYLAYNKTKMSPAKPGGVLVIHENRGLTPYMRDVVRRVAMAGYVGLCVDLLSRAGGSDSHPDEGERTGILGQIPTDKLLGDLSAGLDYLKSREEVNPERLAVIGFCFGGGMTWRLVTQRADVKAAVPYYGPNPPLEDVPKIKAAVLGIYGANDARITGSVPALEEALKKAGITYEIKIYDGANHAFHNDTGANYNATAAKDAWERTLAWLGSHA
jgi:carboxymethylenebutenolidase